MTTPITFAQFHEASGSGMAEWALVEDELCGLLMRLIVCAVTGKGMGNMNHEGMVVASSVFYSSTNLRARLEMIDRTTRLIIKDASLLNDWERIHNKTRRLYSRRNVLAHGVIWAGNEGPDMMGYSLASSNRKMMTYAQICATTPSFRRLKDQIEELAIAINAYLAKR